MKYGERVNYCERHYGNKTVYLSTADDFTRIDVKTETKETTTLHAYGWTITKLSRKWSASNGERSLDFKLMNTAQAFCRKHPRLGHDNDIRPSEPIKALLDKLDRTVI